MVAASSVHGIQSLRHRLIEGLTVEGSSDRWFIIQEVRQPPIFTPKNSSNLALLSLSWEAVRREEGAHLGLEFMQPAMDTISRLDTAACILNATSFIETTFAAAQSSEVQAPYDNGEAILRSLKTFRLALSDTQGRLATSFTPSDDALPLQDLVSCRDAAIILLESIEDVFTRSTDKPTGRTGQIATEALLRLKLEESARLTSTVTREIAHVLGYVTEYSLQHASFHSNVTV